MNKMIKLVCFLVLVQMAAGQHDQYTTPVPILKQIDRHNDDGSYTYGYEAADKSFKIETKYPTGEVFGKYGFIDDQGKLREVEYGASKRGFEPAGTDINVPPPTLTNKNPYPLGPNEIDDGQYREDPSVYFKDQKFNRPIAPASNFRLNDYRPQQPTYQAPQPAYQPPQPAYQPPQPAYQAPQPRYRPPTPQPQYYQPPAPQHRYQAPAFQPQQQQPYHQPAPQYNAYNNNAAPQHFHPAVKSLDIWSGSYSIDYTGRK